MTFSCVCVHYDERAKFIVKIVLLGFKNKVAPAVDRFQTPKKKNVYSAKRAVNLLLWRFFKPHIFFSYQFISASGFIRQTQICFKKRMFIFDGLGEMKTQDMKQTAVVVFVVLFFSSSVHVPLAAHLHKKNSYHFRVPVWVGVSVTSRGPKID